MSTLTDSIDRFLNFLRLNHPNLADTIQPGISKDEIDEMISFLPFKLPDEVYEFFQKMNGSYRLIFFGSCLVSLENTLRFYRKYYTHLFDMDGNPNSFHYMRNPLLQIFQLDNCRLAVVCNGNFQKSSVCLETELGIGILFSSLTSMMQTLSEGLETGAIYLDEYDSFEPNTEAITSIYKKHNFDVPQLVSEWIKNNDLYTRNNSEIFRYQCALLRRFWSDITLEEIGDSDTIKTILKASQDESHRSVRHQVRLALEELNYSTGVVDEQWKNWLVWYEKAKRGEVPSSLDPGFMLMTISEQLENIRARPPKG